MATPIERLAKALHDARERQNHNRQPVPWELFSPRYKDRLMAALNELVDQDFIFLGPASLYENYDDDVRSKFHPKKEAPKETVPVTTGSRWLVRVDKETTVVTVGLVKGRTVYLSYKDFFGRESYTRPMLLEDFQKIATPYEEKK